MTKTMDKLQANTVEVFRNIVSILEPPPKMTVSEWANEHMILSNEDSAEPGKYSTDRAPYQKEMMDAVSQPEVETIVYMTSAQIGKTQMLKNILGYYIDYHPSPILYVMPTLDDMKEFSKTRIASMIRDVPALKNKVADSRARDSGNTVLNKSFPGGYISMVGSNSPSSLSSKPIRVLLADEIDRFDDSAGTEGDPLKLAEKRTTTFYNRKKVYASTPGLKGASRIDFSYQEGTQEEWYIPCPECEHMQTYSWERVTEDGTAMVCDECGAVVPEHEWKRQQQDGKGRWIAHAPDNLYRTQTRSFHLNELASPWVRWPTIMRNFLSAKALGEEGLKVWINTSLGEPFETQGDTADDAELYARRIDYGADLPDKVLLLTAGVDVQDNRLECEVVGWGEGHRSWGVQYFIIFGDPGQSAVWEQLDDILIRQRWSYADGSSIGVTTACIDSGGHFTTEVYEYCKRRLRYRIYPIKGVGGDGVPLITTYSTSNSYGVPLFRLGVNSGKDTIVSDLKQDNPEDLRYCSFPLDSKKGYTKEYFRKLTAEMKVAKTVKGRVKFEWVLRPGHKRNEAFDIRNYALAALEILNPSLEKLEGHRVKNQTPYRQTEKMVKDKPRKRKRIISRGYQV